VGEIKRVRSGVDGVVFHCGHHIEAGLLKAEAQAAYAGEKIYADGSRHEGSLNGGGVGGTQPKRLGAAQVPAKWSAQVKLEGG